MKGLRVIDPSSASSEAEDPYATFIPDGEYEVAFVSEERFWMHRRETWAVRFRIVDGDHAGRHLFAFYNIPPLRSGRTPSAKLSQDYEISTGLRAPQRIARCKPSSFLADCIVRARVRSVERNANGVERPLNARYSVVRHVVRRLEGVPPALRRRRRP